MPPVTATHGPPAAPLTAMMGTGTVRSPTGTSTTRVSRLPGSTSIPATFIHSPFTSRCPSIGLVSCLLRVRRTRRGDRPDGCAPNHSAFDEPADVMRSDRFLGQVRIAPHQGVDEIPVAPDHAEGIVVVVRET